MKKVFVSILAIFTSCFLVAQSELIQWSNPSFEDVPGPGRPPLSWYFCGPPEETPPDVHPVSSMEVKTPAQHGKTYAGLVVRENGTREALGQSLDQNLLAGHCYLLRFSVCRAAGFTAISRSTLIATDFSNAIQLQIWAGSQHCQQQELLGQTPLVWDTLWQEYTISFSPKNDYNQIIFAAASNPDSLHYNGHILLDHLSPIIPIKCGEGMPTLLSPPDTIASSLAVEGDLRPFISQSLREIKWVRNNFSLEHHVLFLHASNHWVIGNAGIFKIVQSLDAFPNALITVAVGPIKDPLVRHRIRLLASEFMAAGLSPKRCSIRPMKKKDLRRQGWLNEVGGNGGRDILWGVSF